MRQVRQARDPRRLRLVRRVQGHSGGKFEGSPQGAFSFLKNGTGEEFQGVTHVGQVDQPHCARRLPRGYAPVPRRVDSFCHVFAVLLGDVTATKNCIKLYHEVG